MVWGETRFLIYTEEWSAGKSVPSDSNFYKAVRPVLLLHRIRWQFKPLQRRKYKKITGKMGKINDSYRQIPGTGNLHR